MNAREPHMRWWGWGDDAHGAELPDTASKLLDDELGPAEGPALRPPILEEVGLAEARLPRALESRLNATVGPENVRRDRLERVTHSGGKSYADLLRLRLGEGVPAPDAVVYPATHREVSEVLAACTEETAAVVPFGGGTSVVGGLEPVRDGFSAVLSLDTRRLDRLMAADPRALLATLGCGLRGPRAEAWLSTQGLTLGHFPQSWEFATIGGFVATRSAGQASTGYGRIDDLVRGLRCATPVGDVTVKTVPASAAGPSLRELLVGSEGTLGVITEVTLSVHRAPAARCYEGWAFRSFEDGAEALRELEQRGSSADVARLSDEEETRVSLALASSGSAAERAGRAYLRARYRERGCLAIIGFEGDAADVSRRRHAARSVLRAGGGVRLGERPGRAWVRNRYSGPYLRDILLERRVMAETLETATTWSNLMDLHGQVRAALCAALLGRGTPPLVMCHVSHVYASGASLYFTFLARQERGAELDQWRAAKDAASDAIVAGGGTITHHHAVGRDHLPWMAAEVGELGLEVLRATKERLDPAGIMNPGKLVPDRTGARS